MLLAACVCADFYEILPKDPKTGSLKLLSATSYPERTHLMNDILYADEDQQQHQPLPAPVPSSSSRNQLITSLSQVSHNQVEEYSHPYNTHTATAHAQQQKQAAPPAVAQAASDVQLDQLLGPESQADVDDIVRCFTAADALEVFEEFAYGGVPETLQDTSAAEAGYHDSSPPTVPSSLKAVAPAVADESPKGVNATIDPSVFDKFPRNTSLISLSPSPDQIHSAKTSSAESSPDPYSHHHHPHHPHLTAPPIVSDVDSNHSSFVDPASFAFAPPHGGPNAYNLDIMDDLTSAAAAIEQQDALAAADGGAGAAPAAASSKSRGKGTPKKPKKSAAANDTAATSAEGRFKPFHEEKWDQKLTELIEFRAANGHTLVPHTYDPNPQLARWVKRQRRQYKLMQTGKTSTMTPERVAILEEAGFVWDSHEVSWREKVQELVQYREKHGDCLVPSSYRDNPQLATW